MPKQVNRNQDFTFSIKMPLGILSTTQTGWTKEVNLVEWNGNAAKLDIRDWDPNHEHMGRGITLHKNETLALLEVLLKAFGKDLAKAKAAAEAGDDVQPEETAEKVQEAETEETSDDESEEFQETEDNAEEESW